jgi:hypothetical protein
VDLTFIRKDPLSNPGGSPTLYTTGERTLIVQGWKLTDEKARTQMAIPSHEDAVEIPVRMVPIVVEALLELFQQAAGQDTIKRENEKENRDTGVPGTTPTGIVATGVAACSVAA